MCSSFYSQGLLLPAAAGDQLERQQQQQQHHQGDLADMVRSSVHSRGSTDDIYHPQVSVCSNHDQIWSLTSAADIDDEIRVDLRTTTDDQHTDPLRFLDHQPNNNNNNNLYNSSMFLSSSPQHDQHLPIITSSRSSMMQADHLANQTSCFLQYSSTTSNILTLKDNNTAAGRHTSSIKPPISCNVFSQMLHISSTTGEDMLAPAPPSSIMTSSFALAAGFVSSSSGDDHLKNINYSPSGGSSMASAMLRNINEDPNCRISGCLDDTLLHTSSPRNNPAAIIKRSRKSQSKKVVCVPATAPANSRPSGEVVPSDLWAWRKYGQKPIKGSPYPRGYYRCSSSKGCSARKQVERSRTDPNMLVITYTSDHNHPWPTQINALAGSTRSKNTYASSYSWKIGVTVDDHQMKRKSSSSGSDELIKPAEMPAVVMIKQQQQQQQQKVDDNCDQVDAISVQDHSNDQRQADNSSGDYEEDEHYWRCRPRTIELQEYNEQSVQEDDFFAELGEIAGKDHNGFSSFLMDYSSSDKTVI